MRKHLLVTATLAAMLLGSTAFAATSPPTAPAESAAARSDMPRHHQRQGHDKMWKDATADERSVLMTLRQLEQTYMRQDRRDEMQAVYNDVLARSKSSLVTRYAERGLQRVQQKQLTPQERIDQLRQQLDTQLGALS